MGSEIISALIRVLELRDKLSVDEQSALKGLSWTTRRFSAGEEIKKEASRPVRACLIVSGFAARCLWMSDGTRGLTAIHVPGDFVDLHGLYLKVIDHSVVALTDCTVAFVPHIELREVMATHPHLSRMLSLLIAIDAAIERQWIVGLSRRQAESRLAHFFCEIHERMKVVGSAEANHFAFPLSQGVLADLTGISIVHANRTVQHLRSSGLIEWENGVLTILKPDHLATLADFNPLYLNLFREPR